MSDFKREDRYIVIKKKHLSADQRVEIVDFLDMWEIPTIDCVVVESDWPEYELVWSMIESRVTGSFIKTFDKYVTELNRMQSACHDTFNDYIKMRKERDELQAQLIQNRIDAYKLGYKARAEVDGRTVPDSLFEEGWFLAQMAKDLMTMDEVK